jgi:ABC-type transport system involved in multi-copper enzyme maturation permease subunit
MHEVIHFIRPFNAFIGSVGTVLFLFILGGLGILLGLVSRKERIIVRVAMFLIGGFLLLAGGIMSVLMVQEYTTEIIIFTTQVEDKSMLLENWEMKWDRASWSLSAKSRATLNRKTPSHILQIERWKGVRAGVQLKRSRSIPSRATSLRWWQT